MRNWLEVKDNFLIQNGKLGDLDLALGFATLAHEGQKRKTDNTEMITHPIYVSELIKQNGGSVNLQIAGLLHDTVEDTEVSFEDIVTIFGYDVAKLVQSNTENKDLSWEQRKEHTIGQVKTNTLEENLLLVADKYANLLDSYKRVELLGKNNPAVWENFKRGKELQYWYFNSIANEFKKVITADYPKIFNDYFELVDKTF